MRAGYAGVQHLYFGGGGGVQHLAVRSHATANCAVESIGLVHFGLKVQSCIALEFPILLVFDAGISLAHNPNRALTRKTREAIA
jgi:hypothetical protein